MGVWPTAILETRNLRQGSGPIWGIVGRGSGRLKTRRGLEIRKLWGSLGVWGSEARRKGAERGETQRPCQEGGTARPEDGSPVLCGMTSSCSVPPGTCAEQEGGGAGRMGWSLAGWRPARDSSG